MIERLRITMQRRLRSEQGAFTAMAIVLVIMLMMVAGLVVDGGLVLNARAQTYDDVEQAARLGANQIDEGALRSSGQVVVIPGEAEAEAREFLTNLNRDTPYTVINVSASATSVTVSAERQQPMSLLSMIGIPPVTVEGSATADAQVGIDGP